MENAIKIDADRFFDEQPVIDFFNERKDANAKETLKKDRTAIKDLVKWLDKEIEEAKPMDFVGFPPPQRREKPFRRLHRKQDVLSKQVLQMALPMELHPRKPL